jgi:hypothetical protein
MPKRVELWPLMMTPDPEKSSSRFEKLSSLHNLKNIAFAALSVVAG